MLENQLSRTQETTKTHNLASCFHHTPTTKSTSAKLKDANTKPEGDWTPVNVGQHDCRPALENQSSRLSKAGGGNSKASKLSKLSSLMAERFVKGNEQVSMLELL